MTTTQKREYDSTVGGSVVLASHVPTYRYAALAVQEMRLLLDAVRHPTSTKLVFQTLPKHMRRRAMSHHPKRLPRKYRSAHRAQMAKAGKPQLTKRPSRKHRRRPGNLLREYLRRQRRHVWLETHIWHARRFHMIERWGYRLPYASCDKTYRACYRATAKHCLLQDISYHACLQLEGTLEQLRLGFIRLSSAKCGLGITAKTFITGRREGSIDLFRDGQYPEGALGRVTFMWRPLVEDKSRDLDAHRTLWLWLHPSAYNTVLQELIKVFELVSMKSIKVKLKADDGILDNVVEEVTNVAESINDSNTSSSKKYSKSSKPTAPIKSQRRLQFMTKTLSYERIKRYRNVEGTIQLSDLKDTMNRFRLTGPLAQSILTHAFKIKQLIPATGNLPQENWLHTSISKEKVFQSFHETQTKYWQECSELSSPAELMSNMIIALNIEDPRVNRPHKRSKALPTPTEDIPRQISDFLLDVPTCLAQSALWDSEVRDHICEQMVTTRTYCELRAKHAVVPGAPCRFEQQLQPVPILLIQRPGSQQPQYKCLGYGCGWEVIAPAGYGMAIWLSLIMWGAKPGGLREFDSIAREMGTEQHLPDTVAGQQSTTERYAELCAKYFRQPPNKRCNYRKFAVASPFRAPFAQLVRDWLPDDQAKHVENDTPNSKFYILRDRLLLQQLNKCLTQNRKNFIFPNEISPNCLIQLQLQMKSRGNLNDFSLICLPTRSDFKRNLKQMKRENRDPVYTEPMLPDPNEKERKQLRVQHKKILKRLRARRVREKRKIQETSSKRVHIRAAGTSQLVATQFKKMCALWLPTTDSSSPRYTVSKQATRECFGYITTASFSYTEATVCGIGYVTVEGLKRLLALCKQTHMKQPMCLVRSTTSRHYRFATFKLNLLV